MVKADLLVLMAMLGIQNRTAEHVTGQGQKTATDQRFPHDGIACEIDIGKTV